MYMMDVWIYVISKVNRMAYIEASFHLQSDKRGFLLYVQYFLILLPFTQRQFQSE